MRNGQNKRMRGRNNHRKSHNSMARVYESNGPDVKIRGNPAHIAEKYVQLARDAQASGDPIAAENYYQHAEHYYRVIATAQEQFRQNNPHFARPENDAQQGSRDDSFDEGDDDGQPSTGEPPFGTREPQPYFPREGQSFAQPQSQQPQQRSSTGRGRSSRRGSTVCRRSSRAANSPCNHPNRVPVADRTAMTATRSVSRCTVAGGVIVARVTRRKAAQRAVTSLHVPANDLSYVN